MKLSEIKPLLTEQQELLFQLPDGSLVPEHFHVTEVGKVVKHFIDCGGTERKEEVINFQLWSADDYNHRLHPEKLLHIIELSEKVLKLSDSEIEVEYQGQTIQKFGLAFSNNRFLLTSKQTDCLAKDRCGIPEKKPTLKMVSAESAGTCTPGGGCC
ncbi:MAG: hypothetical protein GYB55_18855 [Cytophagales bacterium]|uniref:DUF6428 family protein n=1 Tax=Cyclobacterium marinum TaxID=104 RepID=UPI0030D72D70|nr:hypothetical protein [Cytophagales bacterium]|tara:strand:+ start:249535 stop:250002 length:468 start_codon:yes stop_codon:yes gene_type:complete